MSLDGWKRAVRILSGETTDSITNYELPITNYELRGKPREEPEEP